MRLPEKFPQLLLASLKASMARISYGSQTKKRTKRLLAVLLACANDEFEESDRFQIECSWQNEKQLVVRTKVRFLEQLTALCPHGKLKKEEIKEALHRLEDFLEILEDNRTLKKGSEDWHFTLKLWHSRHHREANLQRFEVEWESRRPEKSKQVDPQQEKTQTFIPRFSDYVGVSSPSHSVSEAQWQEFCLIVLDVELDLMARICCQTLENSTGNRDIFGNYPELIELKKVGTLNTILLKKCPTSDRGTPTVLEFAARLASAVEEPTRSKLEIWMQQVAREIDIKLPAFSEPRSPTIPQSYLLVTVLPKGTNRFYLDAELICNFLANDESQQPIKLDLDQEGLGVECTFAEITEKLYQYIQISKTTYLSQYKNYILNLELFLPLRYLGATLDLEEIPIGFGRSQPIGNEYRFVVRSLDRLMSNNGEYLNRLSLRWERLKYLGQVISTREDVKNHLELLSRVEDCSWDELATNLELDERLGLKITGGLPANDREREDLFIAILRGGVPLVLWTRCSDLPKLNLEAEFDKLLVSQFSSDLSHVVESVWKLRKKAHAKGKEAKDYLGYHLGLLYDNPDRVPFNLMPQNQPLIETGL